LVTTLFSRLDSMHRVPPTERPVGIIGIAILGADTMLAALPATPVQLAHACHQAGYDLAVPASWGDELIAAECLDRLSDRGPRPAVMCACPFVRDELLAVGPDLGPMLIPLVAPPVAVARYLHALYGRDRVHLTYVGGCPGGRHTDIDDMCEVSEFLASLATAGISLTDQPKVFDSVIPPDRRRFYSVAGGLPSAEQLWSAGNGRSLVELDGEDYLIDLAQHLLSHECALIDLAPRLGCACSGASPAVPARSARAAVAVIEPPRASSTVVDVTIGLELEDPIPASAAAESSGEQPGTDESGVAQGSTATPEAANTMSGEARSGEARPRTPASGVRSIQVAIPVKRVAGRWLPRAYVAKRRQAPGRAAQPTAPHASDRGVVRIPPAVTPDVSGDENGRARQPARVAAARSNVQPAAGASIAAGASGAPDRMGDGPHS
jgi:hypothetical protein